MNNGIKSGYVFEAGFSGLFLARDMTWKEGELTPQFFHLEAAMYVLVAMFKTLNVLKKGDVIVPKKVYPALLLNGEWSINAKALTFEEFEQFLYSKGAM